MKYICFINILFFSLYVHALPDVSKLSHDDITILSSHEMKNCFYMVVEIEDQKYIIKQKKQWHKPLSSVKEALSAYIAEVLNIAHEVDIIPPHVNFPGKFIEDWPATIHTFAEGTSAHKYGRLRLKQFWKSFMRYEERGLTPEIIRDMARHWQLSVIVALDTFTGNTDRHGHNFRFNREKNEFCAIDMDDTFTKNLCEFNCEKLCSMINEPCFFTRQELEGLRIYRDTLKQLLCEHSPKKLKKKFRYFVQQAGIVPGSSLYMDNTPQTLLFYEKMIEESWSSARRLVALLDKILLRYTKDCDA